MSDTTQPISQQAERLEAAASDAYRALLLVLTMHLQPASANVPNYNTNLDPMAEKQIRAALALLDAAGIRHPDVAGIREGGRGNPMVQESAVLDYNKVPMRAQEELEQILTLIDQGLTAIRFAGAAETKVPINRHENTLEMERTDSTHYEISARIVEG
jgi:hypothetical protein